MKRAIFIVISCISALIAIGLLFLIVNVDMTDKFLLHFPSLTRLSILIGIGASALVSILCYIIQSVMKDLEWKKYQKEHPEEASIMRQQMQAAAQNSITDYHLFQLVDLRNKVLSIFGRGIFAALLSITGIDPMASYIIISYCWFFIKLTGNYIIGIIAAFISCIALIYYVDKYLSQLPQQVTEIIVLLMIFGIFIIDFVNVIRYLALKSKIAKAGLKIRKLSKEEMSMYRNTR